MLWILAVLSTITIIHRIAYTYQQTRILDAKAAEEAAGKTEPRAVASSQQGKQPAGQHTRAPSFN